MSTVLARELIESARELMRAKTRYLHQGRTVNGLDCVGLIICILNKHGVLPADFERRNYGRLPTGELLSKAKSYCQQIPSPVTGCMVLVRWPGELLPAHTALYVDGNLIHCYARVKKIVEHGFRKPWTQWADSYYKLPGVIYE